VAGVALRPDNDEQKNNVTYLHRSRYYRIQKSSDVA